MNNSTNRLPRWLIEGLLDLERNKPIELIWVLLIGLFITGITINFAYDLIKSPNQITVSFITRLLAAIGIALFLSIGPTLTYYQKFMQRHREIKLNVLPAEQKRQWIISGISPYRTIVDQTTQQPIGSNLDVLVRTIEAHSPDVEKIFLFHTPTQIDDHKNIGAIGDADAVKEAMEKLTDEITDRGLTAIPIEDFVHYLEIPNTTAVDRIFEQIKPILNEATRLKKSVAIDVTAGNKTMTVGMALAAAAYGYDMTYQKTARERGEPKYGAQADIITIDINALPNFSRNSMRIDEAQ